MKRVLQGLCLGIPAAAFFLAAYGKATDPAGFFEAIRLYRIIDGRIIGLVVWFLISLEIVAGITLFIRPLRKGAILTLAPLLLVFSIAGVCARLRGMEIPCGCFGTIEKTSLFSWASILRNLALIGLLIGAWFCDTFNGKRSAHFK